MSLRRWLTELRSNLPALAWQREVLPAPVPFPLARLVDDLSRLEDARTTLRRRLKLMDSASDSQRELQPRLVELDRRIMLAASILRESNAHLEVSEAMRLQSSARRELSQALQVLEDAITHASSLSPLEIDQRRNLTALGDIAARLDRYLATAA